MKLNYIYATFNQKTPLKDYYLTFLGYGDFELKVREFLNENFPKVWSALYLGESFNRDFFPKGSIGKVEL
jgi:hypothetical protein